MSALDILFKRDNPQRVAAEQAVVDNVTADDSDVATADPVDPAQI